MRVTGDDLVAAAAELAERILDEVIGIDQDWRNISALARELAALADEGASRPAAGEEG